MRTRKLITVSIDRLLYGCNTLNETVAVCAVLIAIAHTTVRRWKVLYMRESNPHRVGMHVRWYFLPFAIKAIFLSRKPKYDFVRHESKYMATMLFFLTMRIKLACMLRYKLHHGDILRLTILWQTQLIITMYINRNYYSFFILNNVFFKKCNYIFHFIKHRLNVI